MLHYSIGEDDVTTGAEIEAMWSGAEEARNK